MKIILPWVDECATVPKKIEKLMENRALEDWYADHSKNQKKQFSNSAYNFLIGEKRRVRKFITQLSDVERVVVYLRYWENLLITDIAALLGFHERKVESILDESVKKLRSLYISELNKVQTLAACA